MSTKKNGKLLSKKLVKAIFPKENKDTYKYNRGSIVIWAGSSNSSGAAALCANAALYSGAGYVKLLTSIDILPQLSTLCPEVVIKGLKTFKNKILSSEVKIMLQAEKKAKSFAIGPGIECNISNLFILEKLLNVLYVPIVLDADAIVLIGNRPNLLRTTKKTVIITPHNGELACFLNCSVKEIEADRIGKAVFTAKKFNCIVVLKGANTIISTPKSEVFVNNYSNAKNATLGAGDILTGIIGAMLSKGVLPEDAAKIGVFLHSQAALQASKIGKYNIIASDIIKCLPKIFMKMEYGNGN